MIQTDRGQRQGLPKLNGPNVPFESCRLRGGPIGWVIRKGTDGMLRSGRGFRGMVGVIDCGLNQEFVVRVYDEGRTVV